MSILHIDFETRSALRLDRVSTRRYAGDPTTEVLCAAYALDDGPVALWTPGAPFPEIPADCRIVAYNASFEHAIMAAKFMPVEIARFVCTMAMARAVCGRRAAF